MPHLFFYTLTIGFVGGICARSFFVFGSAEVLCLALVSFACALVWRVRRETFRTPLFLTSLFLLGVLVGVVRLDGAETNVSPLDAQVGSTVTLLGVVVREPDVREERVHLYVRDAASDTLVLVRSGPFQEIEYGDSISVHGVLQEPEAFMTDTGRTFNYSGYLKARGVRHVMNRERVDVLAHGEANALLEALFSIKHHFMNALEDAVPEPAASLGEGITLGVKRALGEELENVFRDVGLIHIVVLSGYNIMIVVEYLMRFLTHVCMPRMRMGIGMLTIFTFVLLVGPSASVVRAALMASLVLIARGTGRVYAILRALTLVGVGMLLVNPYLLVFDPGFQLSFLATLGLIVLAPQLEVWFYRLPNMWGVREVVTATIATQLFVSPFILYHMGTFSVVSVLANVLVLPVVPFAMLLVFLTGVIGLLSSGLALVPGFLAYGLLTYIISVAEFVGALPFASLTVHNFPFWGVGLLYTLLAGGVWYVGRRRALLTTAHEEESSAYDGWTIEEECMDAPERAHEESRTPLPFR